MTEPTAPETAPAGPSKPERLEWYFVIHVMDQSDVIPQLKRAVEKAGLTLASEIGVDPALQAVTAYVKSAPDWVTGWKNLVPQLQPRLWSVVVVQDQPVTVTEPAWWERLRPKVDRVAPVRDGVEVRRGSDGSVWRTFNQRAQDNSAVVWDVWSVDVAGARVFVLDSRPSYPGGLWARASDLMRAE